MGSADEGDAQGERCGIEVSFRSTPEGRPEEVRGDRECRTWSKHPGEATVACIIRWIKGEVPTRLVANAPNGLGFSNAAVPSSGNRFFAASLSLRALPEKLHLTMVREGVNASPKEQDTDALGVRLKTIPLGMVPGPAPSGLLAPRASPPARRAKGGM